MLASTHAYLHPQGLLCASTCSLDFQDVDRARHAFIQSRSDVQTSYSLREYRLSLVRNSLLDCSVWQCLHLFSI